MSIRVVVIEDHSLMLKAISQELDAHHDIQVVGKATHGSQLRRLVRETSPDVVVLGLGMATGIFEPITAVEALRRTHPSVQILVLTGYDGGVWLRELIDAGVRGYVFKSDDLSLCLPDGVRTVHRGERFYSPAVTDKYFLYEGTAHLTGQELALLNLAARGLSNVGIGREMGLSEKTVRNYCSNIYGKLGVQTDKDTCSRTAAINKARYWDLLHEERRREG